MKMIVKTYLYSHLTSFMCKTVLLYCIENTQPNLWTEHNIMKCLSHCLQRLNTCLIEGNCPHFIIPGNNLMARKFSVQMKNKLQENLCDIITRSGRALFGIEIDDIGRRLQVKLNRLYRPVQSCTITEYKISMKHLHYLPNLSLNIIELHNEILWWSSHDNLEVIHQRLLQSLQLYTAVYRNGSRFEQAAVRLLAAPICSTLGSIKASLNLQTDRCVSSEVFNWLYAGLNSDVSSGRLKLASVLYSMGDMVNSDDILREAERKYDTQAVEAACGCYVFPIPYHKTKCVEASHFQDMVHAVRNNIAYCVRFTPAEIKCIPHELQYELFRSTRNDIVHRDIKEDYWMNWAAVDSLPYLYFLQYKTYGQLQRFDDQQRALNNLVVSIATEINLGHKETAMNLLGQCMENENRTEEALQCYTSSLRIRNRNNAAAIHICKLIASIVNHVQD